MELKLTWNDLKTLVISKALSFQYVEQELKDYYIIFAVDGCVVYKCNLEKKSDDALEFESDYKPFANTKISKEHALPKMAKGKGITSSGVANILIKISDETGTGHRYLKGGYGWFDNPQPGDNIKAYLTDEDNILGHGEGFIVEQFIDEDQENEDNQGWWIPHKKDSINFEGFEDLMELMVGLYIKVIAEKGDKDETGFTEDTFRVNLYWGKRK